MFLPDRPLTNKGHMLVERGEEVFVSCRSNLDGWEDDHIFLSVTLRV